MKSYGVALSIVLAALLGSACGAAGTQTPAPRSIDAPAITDAPATFNADDRAFASAMVASYEQTAELTALVPEYSEDPNLVALAADIQASQKQDLETVKVLLVQWNSTTDDGAGPGGQGGSVTGRVDDATMAKLTSARGREFDFLWLRSMIEHAQGAVAVATAEIARGTNVDAIATARRMATSQQAEIDRMRGLLGAG